jgi:hypothetical protein
VETGFIYRRFADIPREAVDSSIGDGHVMLGKVVVAVWAMGGLGGLAMTYLNFGRIFPESFHFRNAAAILVLLAVTWLTGTRMDRRRGQSKVLPLIHAANNVILLILAALQAASGIGIVQNVLLK